MGQRARSFLANYTILVAGDLASKFLVFWATARMARVLGTDLFGNLAFAGAFTAYFSLLVSQGLGTYGTQEVARQPGRVREYVNSILALRFCASFVAGIILVVTVWFLGRATVITTLTLLYGLMFFSSAFSLNWVFQALEQMKLVAAGAVVTQLAFSICILLFLNRPEQIIWIPIFQFGGELAAILLLACFYFRQFGGIRLKFDFRIWSRLWKESLPIGLSAALAMVLFNFDIVLLGFMKSPAEVGQYSAAYKFINFFSAFIILYYSNLFPSISRCRNNHTLLRRISDRSLKYTLVLAIPLGVGGIFLARPLMAWIFGPEFSEGAAALRMLFWIIPVTASRVVYRATLLSHGLQRDYLWIALIAASINTGLNLLLIPDFSFFGAAVASVIGEIAVLCRVYQRVARQVVRLPLSPHLWKPAVACLPMIAFLLWLDGGSLFYRIAGGLLIYMFAAWVMGAVDLKEISREIRTPEPASHLVKGQE